MATTPEKEATTAAVPSAASAVETATKPQETSQVPPPPPEIPQIPATDSKETPPIVISRPPDTSSTPPDIILIPSYSRWFSWNEIHETEVRFLPEFFDSRSRSKNPRVYKYYRNSIIRMFRENPNRKITFTDVRKTLVGDVGSIRRVFDFVEAWGLINYSGLTVKPPLKWEDKESKASGLASVNAASSGDVAGHPVESRESLKRICNGCKSVCSIACFACDKFDLTLCARCYVSGKYRAGVIASDFRRVEISEELKTDWTDRETLQLLEAILHYGEDWRKVAEHVGGRSEKDCVARFIKLPFGEQYLGPQDSGEIENKLYQVDDQNDAEFGMEGAATPSPNKRMRLTPLVDASNPIMAQAAFLSALVGVEVAEAAARAAVAALSDVDHNTTSGTVVKPLEGGVVDAQALLKKDEMDVVRAISDIAEVQMKEIQEKIIRFEEFDFHLEKERHQLQQMKNLLFADQLSLYFHQTKAKTGEKMEEDVKSLNFVL